jgi:hypothetical protein
MPLFIIRNKFEIFLWVWNFDCLDVITTVIIIIIFYYSVREALIPTFSDRRVEYASSCVLILVQCRDHLHIIDVCHFHWFHPSQQKWEAGWLSRYSDGLPVGQPGFDYRHCKFCFSLLPTASPRPTLGPTQPLFQWVPGIFPRVVGWQGREADRSPLSSADVKNGEAVPSLPRVFIA